MRILFSIFFFFIIIVFSNNLFSQKQDTLYHKQLYNYIEYYPIESLRMIGNETNYENKILFFGNKKDSLKNGEWIYFYPNGKVLAKGKFKNGLKKGKWKYYFSDSPTEVIFSKKSYVKDKISFDKTDWPKVIDVIKSGDGYFTLENGRPSYICRSHFLD